MPQGRGKPRARSTWARQPPNKGSKARPGISPYDSTTLSRSDPGMQQVLHKCTSVRLHPSSSTRKSVLQMENQETGHQAKKVSATKLPWQPRPNLGRSELSQGQRAVTTKLRDSHFPTSRRPPEVPTTGCTPIIRAGGRSQTPPGPGSPTLLTQPGRGGPRCAW